jgi:hypothetical protein
MVAWNFDTAALRDTFQRIKHMGSSIFDSVLILDKIPELSQTPSYRFVHPLWVFVYRACVDIHTLWVLVYRTWVDFHGYIQAI